MTSEQKPRKHAVGDLSLMQVMQRFSTEEAARDHFEALRWPKGPVCPHCGNAVQDRIYKVTSNPEKKIRPGLYKCAECADQFTVTVGTVCEDTHIPLNKWLIAFYMMCASKTQISALQVQYHLVLGSYRSAWFMCHRIRYALHDAMPAHRLKGTVEVDEMYVGGEKRGMGRRYVSNKTSVVSRINRSARVRTQVESKVTGEDLGSIKLRACRNSGNNFASPNTVNHGAKEYALKDKSGLLATINTPEGFYGNAKCAFDGTHHHISDGRLPLFLAEPDCKYNTREDTDGERVVGSIQKISGKRLMLRRTKSAP